LHKNFKIRNKIYEVVKPMLFEYNIMDMKFEEREKIWREDRAV
jgi:hypothetical protein